MSFDLGAILAGITILGAAAAVFRTIWSMGGKVSDIEYRLTDHDRKIADQSLQLDHVRSTHRQEYAALLLKLDKMVAEMTEVRLSVARIEAKQED